MTSRERLLITSTLIVAATLAASTITIPVLAASPHFVGAPHCTTSSSGGTKTLTCSGKIAGLGSVSTVNAQLISHVSYLCTLDGQVQSGGDNEVSGTLQVSNGQTVFTLSVSASPNCPSPQVASVTFDNVRVIVGGTVLPIPGSFDP